LYYAETARIARVETSPRPLPPLRKYRPAEARRALAPALLADCTIAVDVLLNT
jgi:hypothetical protein